MKFNLKTSLATAITTAILFGFTGRTLQQIPTPNQPIQHKYENGIILYSGTIVNMMTYYDKDFDSIPEKITQSILGPYTPAIKQIIPIEINDSTINQYKKELAKLQ
jgi:hypothetical protein